VLGTPRFRTFDLQPREFRQLYRATESSHAQHRSEAN
jgi:hypothetical protein